jgi:homoserine/homoserine lactone efflux protein
MDWYALISFVTATMLVLMTPGPTMAIVVHNTLRRGTTAGLLTATGAEFGRLCLLGVTFLGVMASPRFLAMLLQWLPLTAALYLIWLAGNILSFHDRRSHGSVSVCSRRPLLEGLTVALANPAALAFYTAFFPQFIHTHEPFRPQILALGSAYLCTAIAFDLAYIVIVVRIKPPVESTWIVSRAKLITAVVYLLVAAMAVAQFVSSFQ